MSLLNLVKLLFLPSPCEPQEKSPSVKRSGTSKQLGTSFKYFISFSTFSNISQIFYIYSVGALLQILFSSHFSLTPGPKGSLSTFSSEYSSQQYRIAFCMERELQKHFYKVAEQDGKHKMMKQNVEKVNLKVWVDLTGEVLNSQLSKTRKAEHSVKEHFPD